ncbi:MAG: ACP S-malonyltransferase [Planctomycetota bacterium]
MQPPIRETWSRAALAFRGYNTANLGRTKELLACPAYADTLRKRLAEASSVCSEVLGRKVDLQTRVCEGREATLDEYAEAVALVFAVERAQLDLVRDVHGVDPHSAELVFGYSLGELVAMAVADILVDEEALRVPLAMATDCAKLASGVTMGVLFSRALPIDERLIVQLCDEITQEGGGVIGISAILSPNTLLVLGQNATIDRLGKCVSEMFSKRVHLRLNDSQWPPLHTPIVWQQNIADRASVMIQGMKIANTLGRPPVVSLVTGKPAGCGAEARQLLRKWVDHPQRLWDAVRAVLHSPAQTVVHVGPAPNVIPATFHRLSENIRQLRAKNNLSGLSARALGPIADRPWLASRLPTTAALLRAPQLRHVILEDWLVENAPS